ncbi:MAG TPA: tetratricopeptide repeat protein, partial [Nannocystaceae bacterium]|nr:tetratricopeptide repeat protein [Nannocystaceae bacterium]
EARVYETENQFEQAQAMHERALALREATFGPQSIEVAASLQGLGRVARAQAKPEIARGHWLRARDILVAALGPIHPDVASVEANLGVAAHELGDGAEARAHQERALAIDVEIYGVDSPQIASNLQNLAILFEEQGPVALALAYHARALQLREREDPRSAATGRSLHNVGVARELLGDDAGAMADYERALLVLSAALGDADEDVARVRISIGNLQENMGEHVAAIATLQRARDELAAALGEAHSEVAIADVGLGRALLGARRPADAAIALRRGLASFEAILPGDHPHLAATLEVLAHALEPSAPAEALASAERALTIARKDGVDPVLRAQVEITVAQLTADTAVARALLEHARAPLLAALPRTRNDLATLDCLDAALAKGQRARARCGTIAPR